MTDWTAASCDVSYDDTLRLYRPLWSRMAPVAIAVAAGAIVAACMLRADAPTETSAPGPRAASSADTRNSADGYGDLLNPAYSLGLAPVQFAKMTPLRSTFMAANPPAPVQQVAAAAPEVPPVDVAVSSGTPADVPVPAPRPAEFQMADVPEIVDVPVPAPRPPELRLPASRPPLRAPVQQATNAPSPAAPDSPGILERLFGGDKSQPSGPALAYAAPESAGGGPRLVPSVPQPSTVSVDRATAVYDISARTVTLPDGTRLEAHSGLGPMLDDPRNVHVRMRGATPPATYDLTLREKLFHGVQAIRLTPINDRVFGRSGLLAHTFMLGPNGDSNGCVSFRNYDAFLQAFLRGHVKRLVVVARAN